MFTSKSLPALTTALKNESIPANDKALGIIIHYREFSIIINFSAKADNSKPVKLMNKCQIYYYFKEGQLNDIKTVDIVLRESDTIIDVVNRIKFQLPLIYRKIDEFLNFRETSQSKILPIVQIKDRIF